MHRYVDRAARRDRVVRPYDRDGARTLPVDTEGSSSDPFYLERFIRAQAPVYQTVLGELRAGRKRSHWMWFIFPQHRDLGRSATSQYYGIRSLAEASAYLAHAELGPRLIACVQLLLKHRGKSLGAIFANPDDLKFRSSMTLFAVATESRDSVFSEAIACYCAGKRDMRTEAALKTAH